MVLFPVAWLAGTSSITYRIVYSLLTAFILLAVARIVTEAISEKQNSWRGAALAGVLAITLGRLAWVGMPAIKYYSVIGIVEGVCLFWAGICLGYLAAHTHRWDIALTLAILWILQALFRFGFYLHYPTWMAFNWRIPPVLAASAFVIIGLLGQRRDANQSIP